MHHIHHTRGFILESRSVGSANKLLYIFTRDFGLLMSSAQGLREIHSKLRYHLEDYTESYLSLVHGKSGWRITGAEVINQWFHILIPQKMVIVAHVFALLRRLLVGEEANVPLYNIIESALGYLKDLPNDLRTLSAFETLLVLRILHNLGYIGEMNLEAFTKEPVAWNETFLTHILEERQRAIAHINRALKESHL